MFGKIQMGSKDAPKPRAAISSENETRTARQDHKTKPINKRELKNSHKGRALPHGKPQDDLKGSKFRILNELLYTSTSEKAVEYFKQHQQDFETYHDGFRHQATKWSQNPLHTLIAYLKSKADMSGKTVLDLGCGEAELQQKLSKHAKIRSFDLVAKKPFVEAVDIAHLPVQDHSVDFCVFCLSLMGTNYLDFLKQARRVLKKKNSQLLIAEVESRSKDWKKFVAMVESLGFSCFSNKTNNFFRMLYFKSDLSKRGPLRLQNRPVDLETFSQEILTSCLYKKR